MNVPCLQLPRSADRKAMAGIVERRGSAFMVYFGATKEAALAKAHEHVAQEEAKAAAEIAAKAKRGEQARLKRAGNGRS